MVGMGVRGLIARGEITGCTGWKRWTGWEQGMVRDLNAQGYFTGCSGYQGY